MLFEDYSRTFLHFYTTELPPLLLKYIPNKDFSLLDMGAGDGVMLVALMLNNRLENATKVVAIELSEERCQRLRAHTNFDILCADVTDVPQLEANSFDYVICTQVIEHVDQDKLLAEIKRLLKPEGVVYLASVVKKWYGWWYYKTLQGKWGLDPTHLREYGSKQEYEGIISKAGFSIQETVTSPLKLSLVEFIVRRIIIKIANVESINTFFLKNKFADYIRKKINIHPPGYFIIETIAQKL